MKLFFILVFILFLFSCASLPENANSDETEIYLGRAAFSAATKNLTFAKNEKIEKTLKKVGEQIVKASSDNSEMEWEYFLIESPQKDAFAVPGAIVAITSGLIPTLQNEAGLATVLSHVMAHVLLGHFTTRLNGLKDTKKDPLDFKKILENEEEGKTIKVILASLGLGTLAGVSLPFSREQETEADSLSLKLLARAGYDPNEAPKFWDLLEKTKGKFPAFLSTHPTSNKRKFNLEKQINHVLPFYEDSAKYGAGEAL